MTEMNCTGDAVVAATAQTILIIDDDYSVRQMLGRVMAGQNYRVLTAANGLQALAIAAGELIDLVLLDLCLPELNGWEVFERLTSANPCLAVVIITGRPDQNFTAMGAGVGALMEKPLDFPKLLRTIAALLRETAEQRLARMPVDSREKDTGGL
jgi:DNA-binding response OmpR family regulator